MVHLQDAKQVVSKLRDRELSGSDLQVFWAVVANVDPRSGYAEVTVRELATQLGMNYKQAINCVSRLRKGLLLAKWRDPASNASVILPNPYVVSCGGLAKRGYLWKLFQQALE
jgi:hypothetical protein